MKTFKEFVAEAKKGVEGDHHAEATKLVKKHDKHIEEADDPEDGKLHLSGVHKDKVHKLHADLEKAGYKKHSAKTHPQHGVRTGGGGDGKVYHHYQKGNTSVHVSDHPNAEGHGEYHGNFNHHFVEVHTK